MDRRGSTGRVDGRSTAAGAAVDGPKGCDALREVRADQSAVVGMNESMLKAGNRGSVWRRWEPHVHTPGTVLEDRYPKENGWELYLDALEAASPRIEAIGVTDYCITRSYERMREEKAKGRLQECEVLFPNVELRLKIGTVKGNFVNIHLLVSPEDPRHVDELNRFLGRLSFSAFDDEFTCTPSELARLGRRFGGEDLDEEAALKKEWCSSRCRWTTWSIRTAASSGLKRTSSSR